MFLRIFYSIFLIGIVNEMCHAERLRGCKKFSDHLLGSPAGPQEVVVTLSSDPTLDVSYMSLDNDRAFRPEYLELESCEKGAKTHDVINSTTIRERVKKYRDQNKRIRIEFLSLENNCTFIAEIKSQIEKALFPKPTQPTLYVDLTKKNSTIRKAVKISEEGYFLLVDDCKADDGDYRDHTYVKDIFNDTVRGVRDAVKIEFTPETEFCQPIIDIAKTILDSLKSKHSTIKAVTDLPDPTALPSTIEEGSHVKYKNGKYALVNGCKTKMSIELSTAAELEDVLDNIANPEIERVEAALNKP